MRLIPVLILSLSPALAAAQDRFPVPQREEAARSDDRAAEHERLNARREQAPKITAPAPELTIGKIVNAKCRLMVEREGKTYSAEPLPVAVAMGDVVTCVDAGEANIEFNSGALLMISGNSGFKIENYMVERDGRDMVSLLTGALSVSFQFGVKTFRGERFQVQTPTGTIGVRGTRFKVKLPSKPGGDEIIETFEGVVSVRNRRGREVLVPAGNFVTMAGSGRISGLIPLGRRQ